MWDYTEKVMEHFQNPRNQGAIDEISEGERVVTGEVGSIACGDALKLYLKIDEKSQTISDARFQTFGCASAIASSSALTELLKGIHVDDALKVSNKEIADYLGGLPEEKMHCSVMGQEALEAAIYTYKGIPLDTHEEDEGRVICTCFGITDAKIKRIVRENNLTTAEQVTNYVKAGGSCTSCLADIDDLIAEVVGGIEAIEETAVTAAPPIAPNAPKQPLTNLQKMTLIQQVIAAEIRPILEADGGGVELFDVEGDRVKVILKGACGSCSSSLATLKYSVEARLRDRVAPTLTVESV